MLKLTGMASRKPLAIDRDAVKGVEPHPSGGTLLMTDPASGRALHVQEPYAKVMRALSMRGRRQ